MQDARAATERVFYQILARSYDDQCDLALRCCGRGRLHQHAQYRFPHLGREVGRDQVERRMRVRHAQTADRRRTPRVVLASVDGADGDRQRVTVAHDDLCPRPQRGQRHADDPGSAAQIQRAAHAQIPEALAYGIEQRAGSRIDVVAAEQRLRQPELQPAACPRQDDALVQQAVRS